MKLIVPKVDDFEVTGDGGARAWNAAEWQTLSRVGAGAAAYATKAKIVYSATGIYFLADCQDGRLTCTHRRDNDDLFTEDVIEVFLWPHEGHSVYFEYEISPLNVELPILVANHGGRFHGWLPWHFRDGRKTRHAASVRGGPREPMAAVEGWSAEFFIPFALLAGLGNTPPAGGTAWRANIYRIDYDARPCTQWAWCPDTGGNFHAYQQFGTLVFE